MNQNISLKVGLFLSGGLIVLIVSVFMLGSNKSLFQNNSIFYTYFESVQGLNAGSVVTVAGVKAGNIQDIEFEQAKGLVKVTFTLLEELATQLKTDATVEMRTQGALGDKFLYITPSLTGTTIKENTEIKSNEGHDILSVINKRGSESEKLFDMISDLNQLIKTITVQNKIPSLINRLDQTAQQMNLATQKINHTLENAKLDSSLLKFNQIMTKIDSGQGTLGALINDRSLHDRLKNILGAGQKQQQIKSIIKSSIEDE